MKRVQHVKSAKWTITASKKCNMDIMQLDQSATKIDCNTKKVQHEKRTTLNKCDMKKVTRGKYGKKSTQEQCNRVHRWILIASINGKSCPQPQASGTCAFGFKELSKQL